LLGKLRPVLIFSRQAFASAAVKDGCTRNSRHSHGSFCAIYVILANACRP
jgi:hypothetical protein